MTIEEVFKNKEIIIAQKKNSIIYGDVVLNKSITDENGKIQKSGVDITVEDPSILNAKLVINTTGLIDSHMDCHVSGLWKKSISEIKQVFLLQEHEMDFENIIADSNVDKLEVSTQSVSWKKLGFDFQGNTEALIFDVQIKKEVNPFMFDLYRKGRVSQHSVGMRYVKIFLCINSNEPNYSSEKQNWDKYFPNVVNQDLANEKGFFFAVTEAKIVEGSAVVKASNECTPVMEIEIEKEEIEAVIDTSKTNNEPTTVTQTRRRIH